MVQYVRAEPDSPSEGFVYPCVSRTGVVSTSNAARVGEWIMATTQDRLQQSERLEELWKQPSAESTRTRVDPRSPVARAYRESRDWSRPLLGVWIATMSVLSRRLRERDL